MLTESFLRQAARDHSLTCKQEDVFLRKIFQNQPYDVITDQLEISKAACLKRMGEVYDKFEIRGSGRGKEQKLRKKLLAQTAQFQDTKTRIQQPRSSGDPSSAGMRILPSADWNLDKSLASPPRYDAWIQTLRDWFVCLGYQFDSSPEPQDQDTRLALTTESAAHVEWVVQVRARRGWDKIVIHAVRGEAQLSHVRTLHEATHRHAAVEGWLVAHRRTSSSARAEVNLPNSQLFCYTFDELIDEEIDFDSYFEWLEETVESKEITDNYIPLACRKAEFVPSSSEVIAYSHYGQSEGWIDSYIDRWLDDPVKEHISVLGEFGTGKTWFTLHYAWQTLEKYKQAKEKGVERPRLPLIISLRDCGKSASLESLILDYFFRKYQISIPSYQAFEQLNRMGKLLLIFDGFDEMASKVDRQSMINNFWQLARVVVPGSKVILTCRTEHFPDAKQGRSLLSAELKASTDALKAESPQFEVLELEPLSDEQIQRVITSLESPAITHQFASQLDLLEIARRPLMLALILQALPAISSGQPADLARIYLYTVRSKMEKDISAERTFTSLADKLYFLCELSWEMLSTEQMSLSYKRFPARVRQFFGEAVEADTDLDHWHYDMMGQTMLIRNERGEYSPAHRSFLEFFAAFKLVAELGCLAPDFVAIAQNQSHIDDAKTAKGYLWSEYFKREVNRLGQVVAIAPLETFVQEERSHLSETLGHSVLSKALLEFMLPMMNIVESRRDVSQRLSNALFAMDRQADADAGYLTGNLITLLLKVSSAALQGKDLSDRIVRGADFTAANLRNVSFTHSQMQDCIFPQKWSGDLSVSYSSDGCWLAVVDSTGEISLRDATSYEPVWQKKGHTDWIRTLAFDAKCQTLATGSHDQTIKLWDVKTGELIKTINTEHRVYTLMFSADYDSLASAGDSQTIKIWDVRTGKCQQTLEGHQSWIGAVAFGRNATHEVLASGSNDGEIRIWHVSSGQCLKRLEASGDSIQTLAFDAASRKLASGDTGNAIRVWNLGTGERIQLFEGHSDWVRTVHFSPGGRLLASGSNDKTIKLWNTETGQCVRTIEAHETRVWSVAFTPDQTTVASGSDDRTIKLWDVRTGQCMKTLWGNSRGLWSIAFSADGTKVYCGSDDRRVQMWEVASGENLKALQGHQGRVRTIALSEEAQLIASASDDKTVRLWDMQTGECLQTMKKHYDWVWSVDFSPDGQMLASGSLDNSVILWDTQTRQYLRTLEGHTKFVWSVAWRPVNTTSTNSVLASGSADQTVRLWDAATGACLHVLKGHGYQVASLAFSPDGSRLASVSDGGEIKVWLVDTGECILTQNDESQLRTIAWSPDAQYLASSGLDKVVRLWQADTGDLIREIAIHHEPVFSLSFSPDGKALASGGEAGVLFLSEVSTGQLLRQLKVDSAYKGMDITGVTGLDPVQRSTLISLGAEDRGTAVS
ncbi:NACHT domain-containing protein [cf. Phormidesmis sp. LEGE 11477]|uniref:WD40 domain-containing protein n=1 Tax=cf. Phormidesmis sp. LEGE 11477 TaxID=1828680 RepID=UPI001A041BD0|nr:NACHT domain-containing protein [cf. Phormidesmis sp. LEGE 11477]MBE9062477.1 NACHT domain-containing protein [cf. Phormidesmis sp. LEGE 11477]